MTTRSQQGYTLIEVIIALTIFAIIATLSVSVLMQAFNTSKHLAKEGRRLNTLQLAITLIRRDTAQIIIRPIRGAEMHLFPPFVGEANYMEFTRAGIMNPNAVTLRSTLQRVAWLCEHKQLVRRTWNSLDGPAHKDYEDKIVLNHLQACSFAYLSHNLHMLPEWRPYAVKQNQTEEFLPSAIQLTITPDQLGRIRLLFIVPKAFYDT